MSDMEISQKFGDEHKYIYDITLRNSKDNELVKLLITEPYIL